MKPWVIIVIITSICLLSILLALFLILRLKKKKNVEVEEYPNLVLALGGKENIISTFYKGSRIGVEIKDKKQVDKDRIKQEGIDTIVVSSKKVTMVVGNDKSNKIYNYINNLLDINE